MCVNFYSAPCNLASKWTVLLRIFSVFERMCKEEQQQRIPIHKILTTTCSHRRLLRFPLIFHVMLSSHLILAFRLVAHLCFVWLYIVILSHPFGHCMCDCICFCVRVYLDNVNESFIETRSCAPFHTQTFMPCSHIFDLRICRSVWNTLWHFVLLFFYRYVMRIHFIYIPITC